MDLKSIINSESSNAPAPRPTANQAHQYHQQSQQSFISPSSSYHGRRDDARAQQPPPLQPPPHRDMRSPTRSLSYHSIQSPYTSTPTSLNGNQYPFPTSSIQGTPHTPLGGPPYPQRDRVTTVITPGTQPYGQSSPSNLTPTVATPGSTYGHSQHQRPHSSHSSITPTSAQNHTQHFSRDSPHIVQNQSGVHAPRYSSQHYQPQPKTPLGPPPLISKPSPKLHREGSGSSPYVHDHYRGLSISSSANPQGPIPSLINDGSGPLASSPTGYHSRQPPSRAQSYRTDEERERSLSVSPKTRLPRQTKLEPSEGAQDLPRVWDGTVNPTKYKVIEQITEETALNQNYGAPPSFKSASTQMFDATPPQNVASTQSHESQSLYNPVAPLNGTLDDMVTANPSLITNPPLINEYRKASYHQRTNTLSPKTTPATGSTQSTHQRINTSSPKTSASDPVRFATDMEHSAASQSLNSALSSSKPSIHQSANTLSPKEISAIGSTLLTNKMEQPTPPQLPNHGLSSITPFKAEALAPLSTNSTLHEITRKRRRHEEPPIYARKASRGNHVQPGKRMNMNKIPPPKPDIPDAPVRTTTPLPTIPKPNSTLSNEVKLPMSQPNFADDGPLGPWESSILGLQPSEELTRVVSDFIWRQVVERDESGEPPSATGPGHGAVFEIEAKLGQLLDKNTNDRLRLPVKTECVLDKDDPHLRIAFKSSMTEAQHRSLNLFLNGSLMNSMKPKTSPTHSPTKSRPKPRIAITYKHTKERDTFYELNQAGELGLPPSIRIQLHPHHRKAKVRITTDQKTGEELAKIVKVRIADLDVYSPNTAFDWRVSINSEVPWQGDKRDLVEVYEGRVKAPDRNKDRMSYRHLCYRIDLTQVTPAVVNSSADKEHELEIEISTADVLKQGSLVRSGQANQYEQLIRGFVDNVRVLARHDRSRG